MASFFTKSTANPTTQEQGPTLAELESVIAAGLDTVEQVGRSLLRIATERSGLVETREAHARELRKVPTNKRPEAWSQTLAAADGNPDNVTAELVASVASKHRTKKARRKAPKTIVLRGKGWSLSLERKTIDVDPVQALNEALAKLTATSSTTTTKAA